MKPALELILKRAEERLARPVEREEVMMKPSAAAPRRRTLRRSRPSPSRSSTIPEKLVFQPIAFTPPEPPTPASS